MGPLKRGQGTIEIRYVIGSFHGLFTYINVGKATYVRVRVGVRVE